MRVRLPKLRYSLAALLIVVAALALVFAWLLPYWEARSALEHYQFTQAMYEVDTATALDVYNASERLFQAELRAPFHSDLQAHADRVARLDVLARKLEGVAELGMFGEEESWREARRRADEMRDLHAVADCEFEAIQRAD